jgi:addiction module HigA family antidote
MMMTMGKHSPAAFRLTRRPTLPGVMLREDYLRPRRVSVARLAAAVGCSRKHMSDIVNGRVRLEATMAARLGKVLGTSAQFWVNLQANVDAFDAERETRNWKPRATYRAVAA